ncbi:gamma-glutamyltransferase [Nitrosomonas halophila]|uniref:Glutathione hydrolase proenzyme n=1 Tax=Nitrosomonas halophila TaxID=44576 RepID=A0A1H3I8F3_9PROT|nr:gamma-glutamyltransferase [Nitrosomonas halophila]SDY23862.1 gamma-glutamyltranspeptidase / glutathione hydrolase [Nitrosomonas halophila]
MQGLIRLLVRFRYASRLIGITVFFCLFASGAQGYAGYAVVSAHPLATQAGERILQQGGNAFDAAVAVGAALAVVEPYASGLGGGGFWLLHRASDQFEVMVDGRETAPGRAHAEMYLDQAGKPDHQAALQGALAAAIPGTPAALVHIAQKYGRLPLAASLAPAIRLARAGFAIDERLAGVIANQRTKLAAEPDSTRVFLPRGQVPSPGEWLRQPQLAATLTKLAQHGKAGFYRGSVAAELVRAVEQGGGIWTAEDLAAYRVVERQPVSFAFQGAHITTASLPSAGGLTLAQALNILERFPLGKLSAVERAHLVVEAMRRAYEDRAKYFGDSDFVEVDVQKFISKDYARKRAATIDMRKATPPVPQSTAPERAAELCGWPALAAEVLYRLSCLAAGTVQTERREGMNTTHYSILDGEGNRVAATLSINTFFGSGFMAGETGVMLNNEMDDFAIAPDVPNVYGLHGGRANMIAPGKRPLSSMSPTFVTHEQGILIAGTPGGSRIISMLLLSILDFVDRGQTNPQKLVAGVRYHHQYLPDEIVLEPDAFDPAWIRALGDKGHAVKTAARRWGNMQLIYFDRRSGKASVASDPRGSDYIRY